MFWRVYDRTDTLLDSFESNIDYIAADNNCVELSNGKKYSIIQACSVGTEGIIYVGKVIFD